MAKIEASSKKFQALSVDILKHAKTFNVANYYSPVLWWETSMYNEKFENNEELDNLFGVDLLCSRWKKLGIKNTDVFPRFEFKQYTADDEMDEMDRQYDEYNCCCDDYREEIPVFAITLTPTAILLESGNMETVSYICDDGTFSDSERKYNTASKKCMAQRKAFLQYLLGLKKAGKFASIRNGSSCHWDIE